jgi:four helix bundle protein
MGNSKNQTPKIKEASNTKHQSAPCVYGWDEESEPLVLQEDTAPGKAARHPFDLEERTAVFGENVVRFSRKIPRGPSNNRLIDQLVGASKSVAANFCEANDYFSKKDFRFTVKRCVKEAKEARLFHRILATRYRK